jgi:hypothetical protein
MRLPLVGSASGPSGRQHNAPSGRRVRRPRRGLTVGRLLLYVLVLAAGILGARWYAARGAGAADAPATSGAPPAPAGAETGAPAAQAAAAASDPLAGFQVRNLQGQLVPLVTPGKPTVVMVNSRTCGWCKRALKDIGELANGRPVPNLTVLTLEGADEGVPMLAKERITGATLVGPAGSADKVLVTFRYPGTPTFIALDRAGKVVATMPGYPIRPVMEQWFAVMVGDAQP